MNTLSHNIRKNPLSNQQGSYFLISALILVVMFAFAAFGMEIGRWYAIEGEMDKAIDGASFAGAKNVSNPAFQGDDPALEAFAVQVAQANFPPGLLGTDTPNFTATVDADKKVIVNGSVNSINNLLPVLDNSKKTTQVSSTGSAKLRKAEIALILDVSGSMEDEMDDLIEAAQDFVANFSDLEHDHKMALIAFASGVEVLHKMEHNFAYDIDAAIDDLKASGWTNSEYALDQAGRFTWTDDSHLSKNERTRKVVIFFSDGDPTAYTNKFNQNGQEFTAAIARNDSLYKVDEQNAPLNKSGTYVSAKPEDMAIQKAQALKDADIEVFSLGLGTGVKATFLRTLSSGPSVEPNDYYFHADNAGQLKDRFQQIADKLKLVLTS